MSKNSKDNDMVLTVFSLCALTLVTCFMFIGSKHAAMEQVCENSGLELATEYRSSDGIITSKKVCRNKATK